MKTFIPGVIMALFATMIAQAQISIVPKAGANASRVALSEDIQNAMDADFWPTAGFTGGVAFDLSLTNTLSVQPELLWTQKGFYYEYEEPLYSEAYDVTLNYLELPVLLKVRLGPAYIAPGPSIAYGVSGGYKGTYSENGQEFDDKGKVKFGTQPNGYAGDDVYVDNAFDFGVQFGLGVTIEKFVIDLRYGIGLANLYDEGVQFTGDVMSQNRCLQLTLGYAFVLED